MPPRATAGRWRGAALCWRRERRRSDAVPKTRRRRRRRASPCRVLGRLRVEGAAGGEDAGREGGARWTRRRAERHSC